MSTKLSNLTSSNYGYDMVVSATQNAINTALKEFLSTIDSKEIDICYGWNEDYTAIVQTDYQTLVDAAGVGDFYDLPTGTYHKGSDAEAIDDTGFAYAFRAQMGLPIMDPKSMPDIITLDKGSSIVTYQLYCQEFSILQMAEAAGGKVLNWTNVSQPDNAPWIFKMNVNLNFRSSDFSKLDQATQDSIKNLNPDSAFSVQQLYLDLNSVGLESLPEITGLDTTTDAYAALSTLITKVFITSYFGDLSTNGVVLGYVVQPVTYNPNMANPSIVPTDLNIVISPSLNANGDANTQDQGYYTLNYLVMTDQKKMPAPVPFTWNWVEDTDGMDFHGAIAINRNTFANYLNQKLSPWLKALCIVPHVTVAQDGLNTDYSVSMQISTDPQTFTLQPAGNTLAGTDSPGSTVLNFSYSSESSDKAGDGGSLGTLDLKYNVDAAVTVSPTQIVITTNAQCYMDISALSAHSTDYPLKYQSVLTCDMGVDAQGKLVITAEAPVVTDLSNGVNDSNAWAAIIKALSFGQFQSVINSIAGFVSKSSFNIDSFDTYVKST